jgi:hypothetical protein
MKPGRKKGQKGAHVHYVGGSGRFTVSGNTEKYKAQWEFLESLAHQQGAGSEAIMKALALLIEEKSQLREDISAIKRMLEHMLAQGIQTGGPQKELEAMNESLTSLVSSFME